MALMALNPRSLAKHAEAASNSRATKVLDWATAIAFAGYAAWMAYAEWPAPSAWTVAAILFAPVGFALAWFDWKPRIKSLVEARMRNRFVRRRG